MLCLSSSTLDTDELPCGICSSLDAGLFWPAEICLCCGFIVIDIISLRTCNDRVTYQFSSFFVVLL